MEASKGWICPRCEAVISPTMQFCPLCSTHSKPQKDEGKQEDDKKFLVENQ